MSDGILFQPLSSVLKEGLKIPPKGSISPAPSCADALPSLPSSQEVQVISASRWGLAVEEEGMRLCFAQLWEHTTAPTRGSVCSSGYDLYRVHGYTIPPMEKVLVKTNIQIALPSGCYGREAPRSDLAKHFIEVGVS